MFSINLWPLLNWTPSHDLVRQRCHTQDLGLDRYRVSVAAGNRTILQQYHIQCFVSEMANLASREEIGPQQAQSSLCCQIKFRFLIMLTEHDHQAAIIGTPQAWLWACPRCTGGRGWLSELFAADHQFSTIHLGDDQFRELFVADGGSPLNQYSTAVHDWLRDNVLHSSPPTPPPPTPPQKYPWDLNPVESVSYKSNRQAHNSVHFVRVAIEVPVDKSPINACGRMNTIKSLWRTSANSVSDVSRCNNDEQSRVSGPAFLPSSTMKTLYTHIHVVFTDFQACTAVAGAQTPTCIYYIHWPKRYVLTNKLTQQ